jgi:hypothetical protein
MHTPGPLRIIKSADSIVLDYESNGLRSCVATLHAATLCPEHGTIEDNAALFSRAPAMHAAIAAILASVDDYDYRPGINSVADNVMEILAQHGITKDS